MKMVSKIKTVFTFNQNVNLVSKYRIFYLSVINLKCVETREK